MFIVNKVGKGRRVIGRKRKISKGIGRVFREVE